MTKIDLITVSGLTASDGSVIASGATLKFDSEFQAASTNVRIIPKLYRNRELFETGFTCISISEKIIPFDFILRIPENEFYTLTPYQLYVKVGEYLNNLLGGEYFELKVIEE
jgi:hypothetical protein